MLDQWQAIHGLGSAALAESTWLLQKVRWLSCYGDSQALEALAKLKKEKTQEAKELRLKLENLRTHRDAAQKLRAEVTQGTARNTEHMQKIQDFEDQMQVSHLQI